MNVYPCQYKGITGFGCKDHKQRWMFVPDMGQVTSSIHRDLALSDLCFTNALAYEFEQTLESNASSLLQRFKRVGQSFANAGRATTVEGQLLVANC